GADLRGADLLGEQDRRLLPLGRRNDDDLVDPAALVEPAKRLREQGKLAEAGERLRPVLPEPFSPPCGDEGGPAAHRAPPGVVAALMPSESQAPQGRREPR